jgi:predicted TIM-barrel fold metal-dependent hydrolase
VEQPLAEFSRNKKFVGVRHVVQDESDSQFMLKPEFLRGIAALKQFDLAYDFLVFPKQLPAAIQVATKFPEQRFVLDHIAKPLIRAGLLKPSRNSRGIQMCSAKSPAWSPKGGATVGSRTTSIPISTSCSKPSVKSA